VLCGHAEDKGNKGKGSGEGLAIQHRQSACLIGLCDVPFLPMISLVPYGCPCSGDV
jgi:hypothetical protein